MNKSVKTVAGVMCATAMVMAMSNSVFAEDAKTLKVAMSVAMHHITGHSQQTRTVQYRSQTVTNMHTDMML